MHVGATKANGCILVVFGGEKGSGFSAQLPPGDVHGIPAILRDIAYQIEQSGPRGN